MVFRPLIQALPDSLVKFFARPYVAGDSLEQGLNAVRRLWEERGLLGSLDVLQEGVEKVEQAHACRELYLSMIDKCADFAPEQRPTVSLKPSSYTTASLENGEGMDANGSEEAIRAIVARAKEAGVLLTCDMESWHWTDWTLDLVRRLVEEGNSHLGAVLQTRLHRTRDDIDKLPEGLRVRLVIGIYKEPAEHAISDMREMKERLLSYGKVLLERGHYVEFATHDEPYVRRFLEDTVPSASAQSSQFEVQMLYGVPRETLLQDLLGGKIGNAGPVKSRLYVPFATSWQHAIAYCRRRLMENPSMASAVGRNLARTLLGKR